ncbi:hypothetical protein ACFWZ0_02535 [[Kitasatospora] papulosa]|uniref:hypothetical protein n=1 Tax=[Kitasatospora] papulosa TaxID=1464011 RepID=UPI0036CD9432
MSLSIVVNCDRSGPYGTCAARFYSGTASEAEAYEEAARDGWDAGGGIDLCPGHRPTPPAPPTRLHPEETPRP